MKQNVVDTINQEIENGMRFFYFDRRNFSLVSSSPDNEGSFYDLDVGDCLELYMKSPMTVDQILTLLEFYNEII